MKYLALAVLLLLLALISAQETLTPQSALATLVDIKNKKIAEWAQDPAIKDKQTCTEDLSKMEKSIQEQQSIADSLKNEIASIKEQIDTLNAAISSLYAKRELAIATAKADYENEKASIESQLTMLGKMKAILQDLQINSSDEQKQQTATRLLQVLDTIEQRLKKLLTDLDIISPAVAVLEREAKAKEIALAALEDILPQKEADLGKMLADIQAQKDKLASKADECAAKKAKLEEHQKKQEEELALINAMIDETNKAIDGTGSWAAAKDAVDAYINYIGASYKQDPSDKCSANQANKQAEINQKINAIKELEGQLEAVKEAFNKAQAAVNTKNTEVLTLQGKLEEQTKHCNNIKVAEHEEGLMDQIRAIGELIDAVTKMNGDGEISNESATQLVELLRGIQDELQKTLDDILARRNNYAECIEKQNTLSKALDAASAQLAQLQADLAKIQSQLDSLNQSKQSLAIQQQQLEAELARMKDDCEKAISFYEAWLLSNGETAQKLIKISNMAAKQ